MNSQQYPPTIQRYLLEGSQGFELRQCKREGYEAGAKGMAQYLRDWQRRYDRGGKTSESSRQKYIRSVTLIDIHANDHIVADPSNR